MRNGLKCCLNWVVLFAVVLTVDVGLSQSAVLPAGAEKTAFDCHGNYWTLVKHELYVLPAQSNTIWIKDELSNIPKKNWKSVEVDVNGNVYLADGKQTMKMNPHKPEDGWITVSNGLQVADSSWTNDWEVVGYMPSGSHDLGGHVLNGKFYMDWSITGDFGYPSVGNIHSKLLEFNPASGEWKIVGDYGLPRGYCATGVLDDKVWTVAGDALKPNGDRYHSKLCQIYDPSTGIMVDGPTFPAAIPSALALNVNDRLYVMGFEEKQDKPLKLYSIGKGEKEWREEPEGPIGLGASYGTELDGKLYTVVGHRYIAIFDTKTGKWETTVAPHSPRSAALCHYKGDIWVMGGRTKEGGAISYIYNPKSKEWRKGINLPREIVWGCAFNIDGSLYLTGGAGNGVYNNRTFKLLDRRK